MDSKLIKHKAFPKPKPSLLKDYLMDDMSSCSSNGFKSFPRKQCCPTTVRFLIDIDLNHRRKFFVFNSKSASSAFRRAIAAVKSLPFPKPEKKPILPRNLFRKILRRSIFWKRKSSHKEIQRLKSFDQLMKEDSPPLNVPNGTDTTASDASSACNSSSSAQANLNFVVKRKEGNDVEILQKNGDVLADSTTKSSTEQKQWSVSEEKEQFSPVSVLDCPFDDDEEVSSSFQHMQGSRKAKIERFGCHAAVEPLNLSKRFGLDNDESTELSTGEEENEAKQAEGEAMDFLREKMMMISSQWGEDDPIREAESTVLLIMEEREWRCFDGETGEMALELEAVVFDGLVDELVVDISSAAIIVRAEELKLRKLRLFSSF